VPVNCFYCNIQVQIYPTVVGVLSSANSIRHHGLQKDKFIFISVFISL